MKGTHYETTSDSNPLNSAEKKPHDNAGKSNNNSHDPIDFKNRERIGKFELIFPFSKTSAELAIQLNKTAKGSKSGEF